MMVITIVDHLVCLNFVLHISRQTAFKKLTVPLHALFGLQYTPLYMKISVNLRNKELGIGI